MLDQNLKTPPPAIERSVAAQLVKKQFGISGELKSLPSERDLNFLLTETNGHKFLLKFGNPAETANLADFQTAALRHLERHHPGLNVPTVAYTKNGKTRSQINLPDGSQTQMRLLTFVDGHLRDDTKETPQQLRSVGTMLAHIHRALEDFRHTAEDRHLLWDLRSAQAIKPFLSVIDDPELRDKAGKVFDHYSQTLAPVLATQPAQIIHNDFSPRNTLVAKEDHEQVIGAFDFGDIVHGPRVHDVAIACAYHIDTSGEPFHLAQHIIAGYTRLIPLTEVEINAVWSLVALRLAMSITITTWRAKIHEANAPYILKYRDKAVKRLDALLLSTTPSVLAD